MNEKGILLNGECVTLECKRARMGYHMTKIT